jgi:hypothetical protein
LNKKIEHFENQIGPVHDGAQIGIIRLKALDAGQGGLAQPKAELFAVIGGRQFV